MQPRWWEGLVRFICNYWWIIVLVIALALILYFTRNLWGPLVGLA